MTAILISFYFPLSTWIFNEIRETGPFIRGGPHGMTQYRARGEEKRARNVLTCLAINKQSIKLRPLTRSRRCDYVRGRELDRPTPTSVRSRAARDPLIGRHSIAEGDPGKKKTDSSPRLFSGHFAADRSPLRVACPRLGTLGVIYCRVPLRASNDPKSAALRIR